MIFVKKTKKIIKGNYYGIIYTYPEVDSAKRLLCAAIVTCVFAVCLHIYRVCYCLISDNHISTEYLFDVILLYEKIKYEK